MLEEEKYKVGRMMKANVALNRAVVVTVPSPSAAAAAAEHLVVPGSRKDMNERISPFPEIILKTES